MATPADQRLLELLDKWLASLELHSKYCSLDAATYWKLQAWPEHERPSRWIIDVAKQKALDLKAQLERRIAMGDATFADSLELMTFLANLVGSEHIERYIPLAAAAGEEDSAGSGSRAAGGSPPVREAPAAVPAAAGAATGTREMPKFVARQSRHPAPAGTAQVARTERKPAADPKPAAKAAVKAKAPVAAAKASSAARPAAEPKPAAPRAASPGHTPGAATTAAREQVIADAARLVQWGRKWYELAELIASMADRPPLTDVRRILKDNKALIDEKAGRR